MTTPTKLPPDRGARRKLGDWNLGDGRRSEPSQPSDPSDGHASAHGPRRRRELLASRARHPASQGLTLDAPEIGLVPGGASGPAREGTPAGPLGGAPGSAAPGAPAGEGAAGGGAAPGRAALGDRATGRATAPGATAPRAAAPGGTGPPVDPRMEQRRVDVERAKGRRRSRAAIAVAVVVVLLAGLAGILHTGLVGVTRARITGQRPVSDAQVLAAGGIRLGEPLIDVNGAAAADRLQGQPWVASATVRRVWPTTVEIAVTERLAVAQVPVGPSLGGPVAEVDPTGRVLAVVPLAVGALPMVIGLGAPGPRGSWLSGTAGAGHPVGSGPTRPVAVAAGLTAATGGAGAALAVAAGLEAAGAEQGLGADRARPVSLEVAAAGTISITVTPGPVIVVLGSPTLLAAKVTALVTMLSSETLAAGSILDLEVPDRPTVTGGSGVGTPP